MRKHLYLILVFLAGILFAKIVEIDSLKAKNTELEVGRFQLIAGTISGWELTQSGQTTEKHKRQSVLRIDTATGLVEEFRIVGIETPDSVCVVNFWVPLVYERDCQPQK